MKRLMGVAVVALMVLGSCAGRAAAQFGSPLGQPPQNPLGTPSFSPFLNLGRGGNPAMNFYGLVRPQLQTQQSLQQLQQQQALLQTGLLGAQTATALPLTSGHETYFVNYSHFFPPTVTGSSRRGK